MKKTEANRHAFDTLSLVIAPETVGDDEVFLAALRRAEIVGEAVNLAQDLVNTPPSEKSPARLCDRIGVIATDAGLAVEIWDEERIRRERFGGLDGVAWGSDEPAAVHDPRVCTAANRRRSRSSAKASRLTRVVSA